MVVPTTAPWRAYPKVLGGANGATVTMAEAVWLASAWLVAVTVTVVLALTVEAVKNPKLEIEPAVAVHVTPVLIEPVTIALNGWVPPETTAAAVGEMVIPTPDGPHVPAVRLLFRPFRMLPEPMLLLLAELMAPPRPLLAMNTLLLMQALVPLESRIMPVEARPIIAGFWKYALAPSMYVWCSTLFL